jgi:4-aminobutyrate aminotransferase-like enzyme
VLEHRIDAGHPFFTLYGHLAHEVTKRLAPGQTVAAGDIIGLLGVPEENGGWTPHLHLQLGLTTLDKGTDWPGVSDPDEIDIYGALFPNPACLLNLDDALVDGRPRTTADLLAGRKARFADNLKLSYRKPITMVRGWKHYLFDQDGRCYLDAYNNVPHVGHCHPRLVAVAEKQMRRLNTNTRYLNPAQTDYAEALSATLPDGLDVCFFLNSASEANELALRLARAHTGALDTIVMQTGYHGNTNAAIDISDYKFGGPGGRGKADWVHVVPNPDPYRGEYKHGDNDAGRKYAAHVSAAIEGIQARGKSLAAFICETFPSVGGQIIPVEGYLRHVYTAVRAAGGLCIADEVQTGLGRIGSHFWAFETQGVVPDIVVLGKPIGNGHPMGALVTTRAIADSFANGMEFFSTFGGSTLSCVIGREVLRIVEEEGLQDNARAVGGYLLGGLKALESRHPIIGEARGMGLFLGVELVKDRETLEPATEAASTVTNRLREHRILIGTDGPFDNVLKIRPPLTFSRSDADLLVERLDEVLRALN